MSVCVMCGAPAVGNDPVQGGPVCLAHAATFDERDPEMRGRVQETIESAHEHLAKAQRSIASSRECLSRAGDESPREPDPGGLT